MRYNETEAAFYLGITKDLLYAFVKTGAKNKKLGVVQDQNNFFFESDTLKEWDEYLHLPWSEHSADNRSIPNHIKTYLKVESGGKCARCSNGHRIDNAHIIPWNESYSHHPHNLIRLCTDCHNKFDDGIISIDEIKTLKVGLIAKIKNQSGIFDGPSHFLYKMPNPDEGFLGRETELAEIQKGLSVSRLITIRGIGGIGKTQLLLQALKKNMLPVYWFKLESTGTFEDFKSNLLRAFQIDAIETLIDKVYSAKFILVFDGLENLLFKEADNISDFIKTLLSYTISVQLCVTSQVDFEHFNIALTTVKLNGLAPPNDLNCLIDLSKVDFRSDKSFLTLVNYAEGHPLTLRIIAGLLKFSEEPKVVLDKILAYGANHIKSPLRQQQNKETSLIVCLTLAYQNLNSDQQRLLQFLSKFPGGFRKDTLGLISAEGIFSDKADLVLESLVLNQFNFVIFGLDYGGEPRLIILNPVIQFLRNIAQNDLVLNHKIKLSAYRHLLMQAYILYSRFMLSDNIDYALERNEIELENYLYVLRGCVHSAYCHECQKYADKKHYLQLITSFASTLYKYFFTRGYYHYGIFLNRQGARAHVEMGDYDLAIEDLTQVTQLLIRTYQQKEADAVINEIKALSKKSKKNVKYAQFYLVEGGAIRGKDPHKAIEIYQKGIAICNANLKKDKNSITDKGNLGSLISEIGRIHERYLQDAKSALPFYLEGYRLQNEIKDYANLYCNSHHLGNCYSELDLDRALYYYKEALTGFIETGQRQYIGNTLSELGRLIVCHQGLDLSDIMTRDILTIGLEDIAHEIKYQLKNADKTDNSNLLGGHLHIEILNKLFAIIQLVSFSDEGELLENWAINLRSIFPNSAAYPVTFLMIAEIVGRIIKSGEFNDDDHRDLHILCFLKGIKQEHSYFKPFRWLAGWLKSYDLSDDVTPSELYNQTRYFLSNNGMLRDADEFVP